ncbi:MAG: hypothetical protein GXO81_02510 [Chlorobi bacterium]|nr:hypothetical protein [Chlorobiota bacterium]
MKRILAIIVFTSFIIQTNAQNIILDYNSTASGRGGITSSFSKRDKNHEFGIGVGFNINEIAHPDDQGKMYYKRLYATKPIHYLHFDFYYHRYILNNFKNISPFLFYDFKLKYSTTRNRMFLSYAYDSTIVSEIPEEHILYIERIEYFGPFTWIEQNIGLGYKIDLIGNLYLIQKIGIGAMFILGYEDKIMDKRFRWFDWEFGGLISVGIGLKLGEKAHTNSYKK